MTVLITVDGYSFSADSGISLLQMLKAEGIDIPALCFHSKLEPQGRCSLCVIELFRNGSWQAWHACMLRCEDGLEIRTDSLQIRRLRSLAAKMLVERGPFREAAVTQLLQRVMASSPQTEQNQSAANNTDTLQNAVATSAFAMTTGCILCGCCIGICRKIDRNKLTFLGKGSKLAVSYVQTTQDTTGCGNCQACKQVCPTGLIQSNGRDTFSISLYPPD